jgi:hypothetical protein
MSIEHLSDYLRKATFSDYVYYERRGTNGAELASLRTV